MYDEEMEGFIELEESIQLLAEKHGPFQVRMALTKKEWFPELRKKDPESRIVLLSEAVEHYLNSDAYLGLAYTSQSTYKYELNLFVEYCNTNKGHDPNIRDVASSASLTQYLSSAKKQNTRSKKAAFLRTFLRETLGHFFEDGIDRLKTALKVKPDKKRGQPRAFEKQQIEELLMLARLSRDGHRNFTIIWTFLGTGIRLNELCRLQVGDINPALQDIMVCGKGNKDCKQTTKITKSALEILCSYVHFRYSKLADKPGYKDLYVFSDDKGVSPLSDSTIQKMITNLIAEAETISKEDKGTYQLSVHSLRHSFALYLLESGVNICKIKDLMRHQWLSSTEVYLEMFSHMLVEAINKHPLGQLKVSEVYGGAVYV
ncbi:tyrosine-type recombinase/integrase [Paenibacillus glucanolyticus]|uniref:tyrosine-type recombinase/integrase n=1 Tax=Paenibacillus glucanolyticus TaxID=59843 RepID=UPI0036A9B5DF